MKTTEGVAIAALLGYWHTGDAATAEVVAAERAERVGDRQRGGVGAQERRDEVGIQPSFVDLDNLGDARVVLRCSGRDDWRSAEGAQQDVAAKRRGLTRSDREGAHALELGHGDI